MTVNTTTKFDTPLSPAELKEIAAMDLREVSALALQVPAGTVRGNQLTYLWIDRLDRVPVQPEETD